MGNSPIYLATGKMQLWSGDDFGLSQPTVSRVIAKTVEALPAPHIINNFIRFSTGPEQTDMNNRQF